MGRKPLPDGACSFWQRAFFRDVDDSDFGCSPYDLMTADQAERFETKREAEDQADPPCGTCVCCVESAEAHEQDMIDAANAFDDGGV